MDLTNKDHMDMALPYMGLIRSCLEFAEIVSIKIPEIEEGICEDTLIDELSYIESNINADIINLSLGITHLQNKDKLQEICDILIQKGVTIVAAFDNAGSISYPAAFENVIGVITGSYCKMTNQFEYIEDTVVNIAAKGNMQRVLWDYPEYMVLGGNSFACAHTTVQVAKYMADGYKTRREILDRFRDAAVKEYYFEQQIKNEMLPFQIKKAVLFPFNKEMHSLIRYSHLLPFEIVDVFDIKYSARVGAKTSLLMKDENVLSLTIKNISDICWDDFDTIIMGHTEELMSIIQDRRLVQNLINQAIENRKNIYMFDDSDLAPSDYEHIYIPRVSTEDLLPNRFGMLHRITKPVLGIMGTSSRQGKFTLQLKIRELLLKEGYNVGQIGTEPSSLLYGMDYVFPIGYNASVYIQEKDVIRYLNDKLNNLCERNKDIIITGSQSGTVQYDVGNLSQYNISQYLFLLGTQPDAVILCINPYDELDFVLRTVQFIESSVNCKVISLVAFPMDLTDDWTGIYGKKIPLSSSKFEKIREQLSNTLLIPVYQLGDEQDMKSVVNGIIDFFDYETQQ